MREGTWPIWQRVTLAAVLVGALVVLVVAAVGGAGQQRLVDDWAANLQVWEDDLADVAAPARLSDVVDGTGTEAADGGPEAVDAVNTVCAQVNALAEDVAARAEPPPAPERLDLTSSRAADVAARHERDRAAWSTFVAATADPVALVRSFCGGYPALMTATATEADARARLDALLTPCAGSDRGCPPADVDATELGAASTALLDGVRGRADALAASCYLADLATVCAAEATTAQELLGAEQAWVDALAAGEAGAAGEAAASAEAIRSRALPPDVVALGLGEDRDAIATSAVALVRRADDDLATARQDLVDALA